MGDLDTRIGGPAGSFPSTRQSVLAALGDRHSTMLHLLGLDHEKLIYRYAGRDFRLTDVYGRVVREILA